MNPTRVQLATRAMQRLREQERSLVAHLDTLHVPEVVDGIVLPLGSD